MLGYPEDGPFDVRPARVRTGSGSPGATSTVSSGRPRHLHHPLGGALGQLRRAADRDRRQMLGIVFATALDSADTGSC